MSDLAPDTLPRADLDDPLYYLRNFRTLVEWVVGRHGDLLLESERRSIDQLLRLPTPSIALLVRMLMRRGELFRTSRLDYSEIGSTDDAISPLIEQRWVKPNPEIDTDALCRLLTLRELRDFLDSDLKGLPASATKTRIQEHLQALHADAVHRLDQWAPALSDKLVQLNCDALFTRVQLMFFGNMSQDLSAFVLTELGYKQFEPVPFTRDSRAFTSRQEVDIYLQLHLAREALSAGEPPAQVYAQLPDSPSSNWLERRYSRTLFEIGRGAEREGDFDLALKLYRQSRHVEANQRTFRVLELSKPDRDSYSALLDALACSKRPAEQTALSRIERRLSRQLGLTPKTRLTRTRLPQIKLALPGPAPVEASVAQHLSRPDAPVYYVENGLINGLFALLCWPALYAPLPGAFFNPFQAAASDLASPDFVQRRQEVFERALNALHSPTYKDEILKRRADKYGIACPFINWPLLSEELVSLALACIPPADLEAMFRRLLEDIPSHRSGLPDLVQFFPANTQSRTATGYRLIEVKGPGDRVQDHQQRWLEFCLERGIDVSVCYLSWEPGATS
ncbi:Hypothetical protein, restriction endonuclease-like VRR-NUC domain [Marinobacterium lacunae]|uniref:phosphodiesterase I n=1 Tax=Marinobacterium lacunae TaxID=1232683 RepID=A0A081FWB9_9GAMM|nr:VRR-NUC domain-containing protein [Marinobacterium lacunae]KEA62824.1 Hypothetical protein, restriction endonuclease-like VRR-NUC domain [Marinobacterium lacunae]